MDLVDIKSEAGRLKSRGANAPARPEESPAIQQEDRLRLLKKKLDRGGISHDYYEREKKKIMEEVTGDRGK
jgi:hypothetical protein